MPSIRTVYRHIGEQVLGLPRKTNQARRLQDCGTGEGALDWIYLQRQAGLPVVLDELNLQVPDKRKLLKYASNYPTPVQQTLHLLVGTRNVSIRESDTTHS
jgi:hypothetical protein